MHEVMHNTCALGGCLCDFTLKSMEKIFSYKKLDCLYQWRSDQFIKTVVTEECPYLRNEHMNRVHRFLDNEKGLQILENQKKERVQQFFENMKQSSIMLFDNIVDINIVLYTNILNRDDTCFFQIRHKYWKMKGGNTLVPFPIVERLSPHEIIANMVFIFDYFKSLKNDISIWYLNYPFSTHLAVSNPLDTKKEKMKMELAHLISDISSIKYIPCFIVESVYAKDKLHFIDLFYDILGTYIYLCENDIIKYQHFPPVMKFQDFNNYIVKQSSKNNFSDMAF